MIISVDHGNKSIKTPQRAVHFRPDCIRGAPGLQNGLHLLEQQVLYADRAAHRLSPR